MKNLKPAALLVVVLLASTACGTRIDPKDDSIAAIRSTERQPRGIAYEKTSADGTMTRVDLLVSDDYRYKAQVSVDGRPALDVVVRDDALAVRVVDLDAAAEAVGEAFTAAPSAEVLRALESRNWVTDPTGAPELFSATAGGVLEAGEGGIIAPVLEALRSLQEAENALQRAAVVSRFNEENPNYEKRVDTFPQPESGSSVLRFDLFPPPLPSPNQSLGSPQDSLPDNQHFRRMSIYIDEGRVTNVLAAIEINPRLFDDIEGRYDIDLPVEDEKRAGEMAIEQLNAQRVAAGLDPIDAGLVTVEILDLGGSEAVLLPTDFINGDLKGFVRVKSAEATSAVPLTQP